MSALGHQRETRAQTHLLSSGTLQNHSLWHESPRRTVSPAAASARVAAADAIFQYQETKARPGSQGSETKGGVYVHQTPKSTPAQQNWAKEPASLKVLPPNTTKPTCVHRPSTDFPSLLCLLQRVLWRSKYGMPSEGDMKSPSEEMCST